MGLPMGQKLVKSGSTWAILYRIHIYETAGWIYTIWSSMELSRPVTVQRHGHLTFTMDFQGQILKILCHRNGRAEWHGMKRMWVDRILDPHCDFELWPHPWPWPLIFKVKFWKGCNSGMECPIRDVGRLNVGPMFLLSTLTSLMTLALNFQRQIVK